MKTVEGIITEVWPGWQVESQIGAGAFGEVYRLFRKDVAGESKAALKVMKAHPQSLRSLCADEKEAKAEFDRMMQRFGREIQLMQSLKGQTHLVSIDDYQIREDPESGIWYILIRMELLTPLLTDLDLHSYDEERLIRMGIELCRGLEVCEAEHIVHRDIKPENIFLNHLGNYKLGDFSTARILDLPREALTEWNFARGERFSAPEVKNGQLREAGFEEACRADIYSVGMVLYWIANGQRFPFLPDKQLFSTWDREEAERRRLQGEPLPKLPSVSPSLQEVLLKACAFDSQQRFESAKAFREALENLKSSENKGLSNGMAEGKKQEIAEGSGSSGSREQQPSTGESGASHPARFRRRLLITVLICAMAVFLALWLGMPVRIPIRYVLEDGTVLRQEELSLRPGTAREIFADGTGLPEEIIPAEPGSIRLSVDWLRRGIPARAEFRCQEAAEPEVPQTLQFTAIQYPKVYGIGLPFSFGGTVASDKPLTDITLRLYTTGTLFEQSIEIPQGATEFDMSAVGDALLRNLQEGRYWLEMQVGDAAGRRIGFSNDCKAYNTAPEHTIYEISREYSESELRGSFTYGGHTYEVYRLSGGGWDVANAFAQGKGGHLASLATEDEFNMLTSFCLGMGLKCLNIGLRFEDGAWCWTDGSPFDFQPWSPDALLDEKNQMKVGSMVYTRDMQWHFGKATQYEISYFLVEYEDILH